MMLSKSFFLAVSFCLASQAIELPQYLQKASQEVFPTLKAIADEIYHDPELGRDEHHAHDLIVGHFSAQRQWAVTPHAYDSETAFEAIFEHIPKGYEGDIITVGVLAEYDSLPGIGHACGHNHIALNGMAVATLLSRVLAEYDIPGRVKLVGCPDEENGAGKFKLNQAGAFDDSVLWFMAHPTAASRVQPMNARLNLFHRFTEKTHQAAVRSAYEAMTIVRDLRTKLPGTASSASPITNIGTYAVNVVQSMVSLGVSGSSIERVEQSIKSILDETYPGVDYKISEDKDGVAINITGPGGHASETTNGALVLSIETFRDLAKDDGTGFYLPGNTSSLEMDITVDLRSRYTLDLPAIAETVNNALASLGSDVSSDLKYPALELTPYLPDAFVSLISSPPYSLTDWAISKQAPASSDASYIQAAELDPDTKDVLSIARVVFHPNYRICDPSSQLPCGFNHEPAFAISSGTEYSYNQTEIVARAEAHLILSLLTDEDKMEKATALVKK
ncbi:hypothetical protein NM208_g316 [Fusarium decemcellulare]|uniref:Uncharacterized protein n=1 Tax=Fusarium decemcellulare TaxID=57161 RepID=A0ACC1T062_9HYPO|nr:hypothetical protein NM208_g316 [Fusarium decemcellulare]